MEAIPRRRPNKIIITITPSQILNYPITLLGNRLAVLRYQRSLCNKFESNNIALDDVCTSSFSGLSLVYGLIYAKDIAFSIYNNEGMLGFFRVLPEYVVYHLIKDVSNHYIPIYITPKVECYTGNLFKYLRYYNISVLNLHLANKYSNYLDEPTVYEMCIELINYCKMDFDTNKSYIISSFITELLTYPLLNLISKLMIYDGNKQFNCFSLLRNIIVIDSPSALYRGFPTYILSIAFKYLTKKFDHFMNTTLIADYNTNSLFEQLVPVLFTIAHTLSHQISLIRRCGSNIDGFCDNVSNFEIAANLPWTSLTLQLAITIGLIYLREKLIHDQLMDNIDKSQRL